MAFIGNQPTAVPLTSSQLADGLITTGKIADGAVVNVDVNSTAAIAYSKLNLATSIVNGDIANATINLTQKVTGTLPYANGGTGVSTLGTAGQALVVNSTATALEFATVGATAGQVIQVITATDQTERTTTSTGFVTASNTLAVAITPSSSSNKIFVITTGTANSDGNSLGYATIYRGATNLGNGSVGMLKARGGDLGIIQALCMSKLDSPATTSSITYQVYVRTAVSADFDINSDGCQSSITCFEIKG